MRQNSTLGIIIALLVALGLGVGAYLYLSGNTGGEPPAGSDTPTEIPAPDVQILEAASDIPANRLISNADFETLFSIASVRPSEVTEFDIRADQFSTLVQGQVTTAAIRGGERIKKNLFRPAGVAELIPTPAPGQSARKAMYVLVTDLGNIAAAGNTVDILGSYSLEQPYLRFRSLTNEGGVQTIELEGEKYLDVSTHVLAQNIPVLKVVPPSVAPEAGAGAAAPPAPTLAAETEGAAGAPPVATAEPVFLQGSQWMVVLAVTEQEAELIDYTRNKPGGVLSMIVRRTDDNEQVTTTGVTMDLLMRLYGVPQVYAQPNMLVDLLKAPPPPLPPGQPPVVIPIPLPAGVPQPLPTAAPTTTP
jgi:pilus assembly protein CpaB